MQPPHPAASRLHLDTLWWTAGAETSERGIYCRACRARSSRLPSLPQASRSYALPPPNASTGSLRMPAEQGLSTPDHGSSLRPLRKPGARQGEMTPTPMCLRQLTCDPPFICEAPVRLRATIFHAVTGTRNGNDLRMMKGACQAARSQGPHRPGGCPSRQSWYWRSAGWSRVRSERSTSSKKWWAWAWRQVGVAHLIDHQHAGGGVATQPLAQQTRIRRRSPAPRPVRQGGKQSAE